MLASSRGTTHSGNFKLFDIAVECSLYKMGKRGKKVTCALIRPAFLAASILTISRVGEDEAALDAAALEQTMSGEREQIKLTSTVTTSNSKGTTTSSV